MEYPESLLSSEDMVNHIEFYEEFLSAPLKE